MPSTKTRPLPRFWPAGARIIAAGQHIGGLPEALARTMQEHAGLKAELGDDFDEDVEI